MGTNHRPAGSSKIEQKKANPSEPPETRKSEKFNIEELEAANQQLVRYADDLTQTILELRVAEKKYRRIFDNALDGIFQCDPDGRLLSANPALAGIFGYETLEGFMSELDNVRLTPFIDFECWLELCRGLAEHSQTRGFECDLHRSNGGFAHVSVNARAGREADGNILMSGQGKYIELASTIYNG